MAAAVKTGIKQQEIKKTGSRNLITFHRGTFYKNLKQCKTGI